MPATAASLAPAVQPVLAPALVDELWTQCEAESFIDTRTEFEQILLRIGLARNFGLAETSAVASASQQAGFFTSLRMPDLVLARACADGSERAWDRFIALYRQPLLRAAIAITASDTLGRELADSLYAELYGLVDRDGERRCPLASYSGRGSLLGWLRTTLAQRHVDHHRRTRRDAPLDESVSESAGADPPDEPAAAPEPLLARAVTHALAHCDIEERFLLASYYLDGRTLQQIATVLGVHEATVSRKLHRATDAVRKEVLRQLQKCGLSRRAAEEALLTDPRDLTGRSDGRDVDRGHLRLKELLQASAHPAFNKQADR